MFPNVETDEQSGYERGFTMTVAKPETYAALLRRAMRNQRPSMSRRDLEKALKRIGKGYSYEHIRKVVSGLPVMSEQFNHDVCKVLNIDAEKMWQVAAQEKLKGNTRTARLLQNAAPDQSLRADWAELADDERDAVSRIISGMAAKRRAEREASETDDPEVIRRQIIDLTNRLSSTGGVMHNRRRSQG